METVSRDIIEEKRDEGLITKRKVGHAASQGASSTQPLSDDPLADSSLFANTTAYAQPVVQPVVDKVVENIQPVVDKVQPAWESTVNTVQPMLNNTINTVSNTMTNTVQPFWTKTMDNTIKPFYEKNIQPTYSRTLQPKLESVWAVVAPWFNMVFQWLNLGFQWLRENKDNIVFYSRKAISYAMLFIGYFTSAVVVFAVASVNGLNTFRHDRKNQDVGQGFVQQAAFFVKCLIDAYTYGFQEVFNDKRIVNNPSLASDNPAVPQEHAQPGNLGGKGKKNKNKTAPSSGPSTGASAPSIDDMMDRNEMDG